MDNIKTFAYVLYAMPYSEELQDLFGSSGGVIEHLLEIEDLAEEPDHLFYSFFDDAGGYRIAPVQLTNNWDPGPYLISVFSAAKLSPLYVTQDRVNLKEVKIGNFIYYQFPANFSLSNLSLNEFDIVTEKHQCQFNEVLQATIQKAK